LLSPAGRGILANKRAKRKLYEEIFLIPDFMNRLNVLRLLVDFNPSPHVMH